MLTQENRPASTGFPSVSAQFGPAGIPAGLRLAPVRRHRSGDMVFAQGDRSGPLFAVAFGCIRVCRITPEGRRQVSAFHFAGDLFGFDGAPERLSYAEAIEDSGVCSVEIDEDGRYALTMMGLMLAHLLRMQDHLLMLGTQNATERVAAFLAGIALRQQGNGIAQPQQGKGIVHLSMSRDDIAAHLGLTLETVSRALHRLHERRLIELLGARRVRLFDIGALKALGD